VEAEYGGPKEAEGCNWKHRGKGLLLNNDEARSDKTDCICGGKLDGNFRRADSAQADALSFWRAAHVSMGFGGESGQHGGSALEAWCA